MSRLTLGQAIRNAVKVEQAGESFYRMLAERANNPAAREFFEKMAGDEVEHARMLEEQAAHLGDEEIYLAEACHELVESAPGWEHLKTIDGELAFEVALEVERFAALYYDTMAGHTEGPVSAFFARLALVEEEHANALRRRRSEIFGGGAS